MTPISFKDQCAFIAISAFMGMACFGLEIAETLFEIGRIV